MTVLSRRLAAVAAFAILLGMAGVVGYGLGLAVGAGPRMSEVKVFRGAAAYVGDSQATAIIDGTAYGFFGTVPWVDAGGGSHYGDWPACLPHRSETHMTFGGATVYGPTTGYAMVLWIDCRPSR